MQVLHQPRVAALCKVVTNSLQAMLTRHIAQQNPSFNASAFFSDYRRVMPHGGGFFQLHAPRELDDFSSVTDRYRMYLLGKEGMPTRLRRFLGWSGDSGTQARFASEAGEVEVNARDVLFCVGVQEDRPRLLKLAARPPPGRCASASTMYRSTPRPTPWCWSRFFTATCAWRPCGCTL